MSAYVFVAFIHFYEFSFFFSLEVNQFQLDKITAMPQLASVRSHW